MGEYADYILNGDDCQDCGEYIGEGDGYPRSCFGCVGKSEISRPKVKTDAQKARKRRARKRRSERQMTALRLADVSDWQKLSDYHFRKIEDGKKIDWWPSTGKWSINGVVQITKRN
jgi:hypothetical protein